MAYTSTIGGFVNWADKPSSSGTNQAQYFEGSRLDDLSLSFQTIGNTIPVIYGSMRVIGNVIQALPLAEKSEVITETAVTSEPADYNWFSPGDSSGWDSGNGWDSGVSTSVTYTTEYSYFGTWAVSLGVDGLEESGKLLPTKIKFDGNVVWQNVDGNIQSADGVRFRFYRGRADQKADARLVATNAEDSNETPAYRHLISMVFDSNALEQYGNRIPAVQVDLKRTTGAEVSVTLATTFDTTYPNQVRSAVDWANMRAFGFSSTQMFVYDINSGAELYRLNYTRKDSKPEGFVNSGKAYIPWLRLIAGVGSAVDGDEFDTYKYCYLLDPQSATVTSVSAQFGLGGPSGVSGFRDVVPVRVVSAGGTVKTFIFCCETTINTEVAVFEYDGSSLTLVYEADVTASLANPSAQAWVMCEGPSTTGSATVYVGTYDGTTSNPGYIIEMMVDASSNVTATEVASLSSAGSNRIYRLYYDAPRRQLIVHQDLSSNNLTALDIDAWTVNWQVDATTSNNFYHGSYGSVFTDTYIYQNGSEAYYYDLETGAASNSGGAFAAAGYTGAIANNHEKFWNGYLDIGFGIGGGNRPARLSRFNYGGTRTSLRTILEGIAVDAGFTAADYDFSDVTDNVDGLIISESISTNAIFADVCRAFGYDLTDYDKVRIIKPGVDGSFATDFAVDEDDLIASAGPGGLQAVVRERIEAESLPRALDLQYISDDRDYTFTTYRAQIPKYPAGAVYSDDRDSIRLPVVITPDEAATLAYKALNRLWASRDVISFRLPAPEFLHLAPGDVGTVTAGGRTFTVKIVEMSVDPTTNVINLRGVSFQSQESVSVTGDAGSSFYTNSFAASPASEGYLVDGPLLEDAHDAGGDGLLTYYGVNSAFGQENWRGARLEFSDETVAANWDVIRSVGYDALLGQAVSALGDVSSPWVVDRGSELVIRLRSGLSTELTTITDEVLRSGSHSNWLLVGKAGRWEMVGYGTVTDNSDGTITLTNLIRGYRGTEVNTGNHLGGDYVIKAQLSRLVDRIEPVSMLAQQRWLRAVGQGEVPNNAVVSRVTLTGTAEKPYAPVHLKASVSASDVVLTWERRTRLMGGALELSATVPIGETSEEYEVEIMDGATVVRTYTGITDTTKTYTSADMTTDWGAGLSYGDSLTFRVYQISALVDRGFAGEATVTIT